MEDDVSAAARFYRTPLGTVAGRLLRERLSLLWPDLGGQSVLGIGHTEPFLPIWRQQASRCIALAPAPALAARWPDGAPNLACSAEEDALPFPDLCFDRVLLAHGLEGAEHARRLLRETWRVLKDDGRLVIVTPNRRGLWAYSENTPFGHGQPYSFGQVARLLAAAMYRVERRDAALYVPPSNWPAVLRSAPLLERTGRCCAQGFAGVTITEAVKDIYAALPLEAVAGRRLVLANAEFG